MNTRYCSTRKKYSRKRRIVWWGFESPLFVVTRKIKSEKTPNHPTNKTRPIRSYRSDPGFDPIDPERDEPQRRQSSSRIRRSEPPEFLDSSILDFDVTKNSGSKSLVYSKKRYKITSFVYCFRLDLCFPLFSLVENYPPRYFLDTGKNLMVNG